MDYWKLAAIQLRQSSANPMRNAQKRNALAIPGPPRMGTEAGDRLLACLHQDSDRTGMMLRANLSADEWEAVFALARAHDVDALLAFRLRSRGVEDRLPDSVRHTANDARRRGIR